MTAVIHQSTTHTLFGQLWRYGATGLLNTALGYGLIITSVYVLGTSVILANVIGYGAGWCLSYTLNKRWTFQNTAGSARSVIAFALLVAAAFGANLCVTLGLSGAGAAYPIAQAFGAVTYSAAVFVGLKWMVFK